MPARPVIRALGAGGPRPSLPVRATRPNINVRQRPSMPVGRGSVSRARPSIPLGPVPGSRPSIPMGPASSGAGSASPSINRSRIKTRMASGSRAPVAAAAPPGKGMSPITKGAMILGGAAAVGTLINGSGRGTDRGSGSAYRY